jgi:RNA polymerase sigma factor (sigma-70 family)
MSIDLQSELLTRESIARLYKTHVKDLIVFARSLLNNIDDAQEVVHDLFCALYDKAPEGNIQVSSIRAFLFVSVKNRAFNIMKKKKRITELSDNHESSVNMADTINNALSVREIYAFIHESFPPDKREIFVLRVIHGLVWREIADVTGRPLSTVHMVFNEGVAVLRERFPDVL